MDEVMQIRLNNWADMIRQKAASGMTVKEWCEANQITEHAYYYRLSKVRKTVLDQMNAGKESDSPAFVQLKQNPAAASAGSVGLRIRKNDTVIEVGNDASEAVLRTLKEILTHAV